ncbi:hypothetical protein [Dictyobacter kobayashii]|uniref:Uncharacterized protein n=1 Tax=Dictyobacter kobayashii TaxID=2014872 RepID=A0A402AR72_9CHLR|nr:hypothetical protein [Dictyobacter kobayashii]GCE21606.1 hypothetical protein KDK_54060 [Dictyobacter kobayashii]
MLEQPPVQTVPCEEQIRIDGQIVEQLSAVSSEDGHAVRVTIIQGGRSKNGYVYDEAALRQIARLIEGAQAYADHARSTEDQLNRSVRDVVGFYQDAAYVADGGCGRVDATLHIFEAADWLWSIIKEACDWADPS